MTTSRILTEAEVLTTLESGKDLFAPLIIASIERQPAGAATAAYSGKAAKRQRGQVFTFDLLGLIGPGQESGPDPSQPGIYPRLGGRAALVQDEMAINNWWTCTRSTTAAPGADRRRQDLRAGRQRPGRCGALAILVFKVQLQLRHIFPDLF
jgi:hypothetical protein